MQTKLIQGIEYPIEIVTKAGDSFDAYLEGERELSQKLGEEVRSELKQWLIDSNQPIDTQKALDILYDYVTS